MTDLAAAGVDVSLLEGAVVVGDDASPDSAKAVAWALDEAERRGVPLVVLRAWSLTSAPRPAGAEPGYIPSEAEFADAVRNEMTSDLHEVLSRSRERAVSVVLMPAHCSATDALVHASRHAALTVVGARGSGLARWLGSVSTAVVRTALGPVTVVPSRERGAPDDTV